MSDMMQRLEAYGQSWPVDQIPKKVEKLAERLETFAVLASIGGHPEVFDFIMNELKNLRDRYKGAEKCHG